MKNSRAIIVLVISAVLGLLATMLTMAWISTKSSGASSKVVVAVADVPLGSKLSADMLTAIDWPAASKPDGVFNDPDKLVGRVVKTSVQRGEPVLNSKLAPEGSQGGLSAVISEGKRAVTVRVNDVVGVAGFTLPGNYVDVMVNTQTDGSSRDKNKNISKIVLERVLVLAVAQEANRDATAPKVVNAVTLELSLDEAERLDVARNVGTLTLVLRNQTDDQPVVTKGVTKNELLGLSDTSPIEVPAPAVVTREVVKVVRVPATPRPAQPATVSEPAKPQNCVEVLQNGVQSVSCF